MSLTKSEELVQTDRFINIPFTYDNLDLYIVRQAILNALIQSLPHFQGRFLDVGCGKMPYRQLIKEKSNISDYIGLDIENAITYDARVKPDYTWDGVTMPFERDSFNSVMATEVLEHCPEPRIILNEVLRVLKSNGVFFFTTPFLWNLHEVPHDNFRFTPFSLKRLLEETGFVDVDVKATGGWHASMAQMLGLWVRRSPLSRRAKNYLSLIAKPIIKKLLKLSETERIDFNKGPMITTIYGIARKGPY